MEELLQALYCIYSHRVLSSYQQQERHHRQKNLYYIYGAGNLSDFSFIDFFACKFTDPYMGNFLSLFPYHRQKQKEPLRGHPKIVP